jgi:Amt family ammonium transporter
MLFCVNIYAITAFVGIRLDAEDEFNGTDLTIHKISASAERETLW